MSTRNSGTDGTVGTGEIPGLFTTSLRSNEVVLEKLLKVESIKQYPEVYGSSGRCYH